MEKRLLLVLAITLLNVLGIGCDAPGGDLLVELQTDLEAGVDFSSVRTELDDGSLRERAVFLGDDFSEPRRIAEFLGLVPAERTARVILLDEEGAVVTERPTTFFHDGDFGLRVVITRACLGVVCPGPYDDREMAACHGGVCVPTECMRSGEGACPAPQCGRDNDCGEASENGCSSTRCIDGLCMALESSSCDASVPPPIEDASIPPVADSSPPPPTPDTGVATPPPGTCLGAFRIDVDVIDGMVTMPNGNIVVFGRFLESTTIGGTTHLAGGPFYNGVVAAFEPDGTAIWSVAATSAQTVYARGAAVSETDTYIGGYFESPVTIGSRTVTSAGGKDGFIARIDETGTPREVRRIGGTGPDSVNALAADGGNLYVGGHLSDGADLLGVTHDARNTDAFVLRVRAPGLARISSWSMGGRYDDSATALEVLDGAITVGGTFRDQLVLGDDILFTGELDIFVGHSDLGGSYDWATSMSARGMEQVELVDARGDYVAISGSTAQILTDGMAFVRVHHRDGRLLWEERLGDPELQNQGGGAVIDESGTVHVVSATTLPIDIDDTTIEGIADRELLVTAWDAESGSHSWSRLFPTVADVRMTAITLGTEDDLFVSGTFEDDLDCDGTIYPLEDGSVVVLRIAR